MHFRYSLPPENSERTVYILWLPAYAPITRRSHSLGVVDWLATERGSVLRDELDSGQNPGQVRMGSGDCKDVNCLFDCVTRTRGVTTNVSVCSKVVQYTASTY
jgi:hypothetical protein